MHANQTARRTHVPRIATAATACAVAATALLAAPVSATTTDPVAPTSDPAQTSNPVKISGPATGQVGKRTAITCATSATLVGGKVLLYQNEKLIALKGVKVNSKGACSFKVNSGISGDNSLRVVVKKSGAKYSSNTIVVKMLTAAEAQLAAAKKPIKISGPKTAKLWKRIDIGCTAPAVLVGAKVALFQNGTALPQKKGLTVSASGTCNFWLKSGITGVNSFTVTALKNGVTYKANTIKITLS